jgi:hypothetical protein
MSYATALTLPEWATEAQVYSERVIRYTPIVLKAFNKTFTPVILDSLKGVGLHLIERERLWKEWALNVAGITHNPLQAAVRAAQAELTSSEAHATYRHIRRITRETAMDALVIGLCGVVAVAQGVEAAQKVYGFAKRFYHWVDDRINQPLEQPTLLPTVDLCLAHLSDEDLAARIESLADAPSQTAVVDEAIAPIDRIDMEQAKDGSTEVKPVDRPNIIFWNPPPKDMHIEVQQRLQAIALDEAKATAEDSPATALNVPGATGVKPGAKASTSKAKAGTRTTKANAKPRQSKGDAEAGAIAPRGGRRATG